MVPKELLRSVVDGRNTLVFQEARNVMLALLRGEFSEAEMFELLQAFHLRDETAAELAGFADAMRSASVKLPLTDAERETLVDTCGTGGDRSGTFNISTAVALVACAAGAKVAKHGNRAVTSRSGSADVLEALGIRTDHTPDSAAESIRQHGFAFLLAPLMHPAMKIIAPVRRALPYRTVFNLLGPMTNPAGARRQVMGVYTGWVRTRVAEALAIGGHMTHALVVHGDGHLDELSLSGKSVVAEIKGGAVQQYTVTPSDAGLSLSNDSLTGADAVGNATILRRIFAGDRGPARDIVLLNAAAVLLVSGLCSDLRMGAELAAKAIDEGRVTHLLTQLAGERQ